MELKKEDTPNESKEREKVWNMKMNGVERDG